MEGQYLVYRAGDKKVLKSVKYSPVDFNPLLGEFLSPTVPVKQVSRVFRLKISGEEDAVKLDKAVQGGFAATRALKGYVTIIRQVCKSEWVYELSVVFDSGPNFDAFMEQSVQDALAATPEVKLLHVSVRHAMSVLMSTSMLTFVSLFFLQPGTRQRGCLHWIACARQFLNQSSAVTL